MTQPAPYVDGRVRRGLRQGACVNVSSSRAYWSVSFASSPASLRLKNERMSFFRFIGREATSSRTATHSGRTYRAMVRISARACCCCLASSNLVALGRRGVKAPEVTAAVLRERDQCEAPVPILGGLVVGDHVGRVPLDVDRGDGERRRVRVPLFAVGAVLRDAVGDHLPEERGDSKARLLRDRFIRVVIRGHGATLHRVNAG